MTYVIRHLSFASLLTWSKKVLEHFTKTVVQQKVFMHFFDTAVQTQEEIYDNTMNK